MTLVIVYCSKSFCFVRVISRTIYKSIAELINAKMLQRIESKSINNFIEI